MVKNRHYLIERSDQLEALTSPVRMEILSAVEALGPCTAAELAASLGRAQSSLYFHLEQLLEVGLLLKEERPEGAAYRPVARTMKLDYEPANPARLAVMVRSAATILRATERTIRRAFESGLARVRGRGADTMLESRRVYLSAAEMRAVRDRLAEVSAILDGASRERQGRLIVYTVCMAPVVPKEQKR